MIDRPPFPMPPVLGSLTEHAPPHGLRKPVDVPPIDTAARRISAVAKAVDQALHAYRRRERVEAVERAIRPVLQALAGRRVYGMPACIPTPPGEAR